MKAQSWHCLVALGMCVIALIGCSSPLTSESLYQRLSLEGVPRPSRDDTSSARHPNNTDTGLPAVGITLEDLLHRAERANPELRSSRSAVGVAAGQVWQAGLYPNPSAYANSGEIDFEGDSANTVVGVSQPIVIGGRLRAAVAAADAKEAAKLADQLELIEELISIGEQTLHIAETRFEARAASEPDVIRPRVEVHQLRADRQRLVQELAAAEKQLGFILDTDLISADRLVSRISMNPVALDDERLMAVIEERHPKLIVADREIEVAQATMERIRAERVPDLNVSAGVGYSEESDGGIAEIGIGAEIPLWDRRQGDLMSARFELMKRRQDKAAIRNRLLSELAGAKGAYDAAREQLGIIRDDVVPDAQRAFDQIDESYRAGRASFIDLLDAQRTLMQSRRTLVQLAGQASVALARISAICGTEILFDADHEQSITNTTTAPSGAEDIK